MLRSLISVEFALVLDVCAQLLFFSNEYPLAKHHVLSNPFSTYLKCYLYTNLPVPFYFWPFYSVLVLSFLNNVNQKDCIVHKSLRNMLYHNYRKKTVRYRWKVFLLILTLVNSPTLPHTLGTHFLFLGESFQLASWEFSLV